MSNRDRFILACIVVVTIVFMRPMLGLGFIDDDAYNSYINGWIDWHHISFWTFYDSVVRLWIVNEGRFIPANLGIVYTLYHLTQQELVAKAVQVALIALNAVTLAAVVRRLAGTWKAGLLAAVCLAPVLQVRPSLDPIVAFIPLLPLTMEFVLLGLLFQLEWQRSAKQIYLVVAVAAYAMAALAYEITYAFLLVHWYLAWRHAGDRRRAVWECSAFAAPIVVLVVLNLIFRHAAGVTGSDPYAVHLAAGSYLRTFLIQIVAAVPLTSSLLAPASAAGFLGSVIVRPLLAFGIAIVFGGLAFMVFRGDRVGAGESRSAESWSGLATVGAMLWLLSTLIIAASPRWQAELSFGKAYLPVYFEYFGVAMLIAAACIRLTQAVPRPAGTALAATLLGVLAALTYQTNRPSFAAYEPLFSQGRFALEEAARSGLFAGVPDGATLLLDHSYAWDFEAPEPVPNSNSRYLFYLLLGKRFTVASIDNAAATFCPALARTGHCDLRGRNVYAYFSDTPVLAPGDRWTRVVALDGVVLDGGGKAILTSTSAAIQARGVPARQFVAEPHPASLTGLRKADDSEVATARSCTPLAADEMPDGAVFYGTGFYGLERNAQETFHWSQQRSSLRILAGATAARIRLSLGVSAFVPGTTVRVLTGGKPAAVVPASAAGTPFTIDATVPPRTGLTIAFVHQGPPFVVPSDPRELAFRLVDVRLQETCPA